MNFRMIKNVVGWILLFEALFLLIPTLTALVYTEYRALWSFLATMGICVLCGLLLRLGKPQNKTLYAKDGFVIVSLSWIALSLFGALPFFFLTAEKPNLPIFLPSS